MKSHFRTISAATPRVASLRTTGVWIFGLALLLGALGLSPAKGATITYTGAAAGNFSSNWLVSTNWSPAAVPTAADDVIIGFGLVVLPETPAFATLTLKGGKIGGRFTNRGVIQWHSGTIAGEVTIAAGGVLELTGPEQKTLEECTIHNAGTIRWGGSGHLQSSTTVTIDNQAGGVFEAQTDSLFLHASFSVPAVFNNAGVFRKSGGEGTTTIQRVNFQNNGKVEIQTGALSFPDGLSNRGTFDVAAGAKLDLAGGKVALHSGSTFSGAGFYGVTGKVDVEGTINAPNFQLSGTLEGTNTLAGRMVWTAGTIRSQLTIASSGVLDLSGTETKLLEETTIDNAGTIRWSGSGALNSSTAIVFNNQAGGTFDAQSDSLFQHASFSVPALFNNAGAFRKTGGIGATSVQNVAFKNSGRVEIQTGTLDFSGDYPQSAGATILSGGTLKAATVNIDGGAFTGTGTIQASVFNRAQLSPMALAIEGNYTQTSAGALSFSIGGLFPGSQFSTLAVSGQAALGGELNVTLKDAFVPRPGNTFPVMTYAGRQGTFATIKGLDIAAGLNLTADLGPTALQLSLPSPLRLARTTDGVFKVRFEGKAGVVYRMEASDDLVTWVPVTTEPAAAIIEFTDTESANRPRRFYRVRTP